MTTTREALNALLAPLPEPKHKAAATPIMLVTPETDLRAMGQLIAGVTGVICDKLCEKIDERFAALPQPQVTVAAAQVTVPPAVVNVSPAPVKFAEQPKITVQVDMAPVAEAIRDTLTAAAESNDRMAAAVEALAEALTAPRKIVRDAEGRISMLSRE